MKFRKGRTGNLSLVGKPHILIDPQIRDQITPGLNPAICMAYSKKIKGEDLCIGILKRIPFKYAFKSPILYFEKYPSVFKMLIERLEEKASEILSKRKIKTGGKA